MNHFSWIYVGDAGHTHPVGLYHSDKSGHLVIYVGRKVVTIDFSVFDSRKYSFFIDDELVNIRLERRGDEMYYFFEIDKEADTPRNRARRFMERKYLRQSLLFIGLLVSFVATIAIVMPKFSEKSTLTKAEQLLISEGVTTDAVLVKPPPERPGVLAYTFIAGHETFTHFIEDSSSITLDLPLYPGDEFALVYARSKPEIHRFYLDRPTERQIGRFKQRTVEKLLEYHPKLSSRAANCLVEAAYLLYGLDGLSNLYWQKASPSENARHNVTTYERMARSIAFQNKFAELCAPTPNN